MALTESDWLTYRDPGPLLLHLRHRIGHRKTILLGCAFCRRVGHLLVDSRSWAAVEACEQAIRGERDAYSLPIFLRGATAAEQAMRHRLDRFRPDRYDGLADRLKRAAAKARAEQQAARAVRHATEPAFIRLACRPQMNSDNLRRTAESVAEALKRSARALGMESGPAVWKERVAQCELIRELIGNPFRPTQARDESWCNWNDGCVRKMAAAVETENRWQDLPILADALEDAGCDDHEILAHCRSDKEHRRGCWVVDMILKHET
jgi:hypothetical protein